VSFLVEQLKRTPTKRIIKSRFENILLFKTLLVYPLKLDSLLIIAKPAGKSTNKLNELI